MKKGILFLALFSFLVTGCAYKFNSMQSADVVLTGNMNYELLGETEGKATISYFLGIPLEDWGIFGITSSSSYNSMIGPFGSVIPLDPSGPVRSAAAYKAIQNFEGADALVCPVYKGEWTNAPIFQTYTCTVKAKAIKIKK